jgi:hypothetical protein
MQLNFYDKMLEGAFATTFGVEFAANYFIFELFRGIFIHFLSFIK